MERNNAEMFFSLVDYRNNYFTSDDPKKVLEFYDSFENRDQLIQWMRERPKGVANIHEVDGDKDIIVVIPTADFNGNYAMECRENVFKGLHIIFVESGEVPDPYFNYSHNCNVGIRKAMEYNPKWVVVTNDDMEKIDAVEVMKEQLSRLDEDKYDIVFTKPSKYHSSIERISQPSLLYKIYYKITNRFYGRSVIKISQKFQIRYFLSPVSGIYSKLFRKGYQFLEINNFGIYSSKWISVAGEAVYEETFINSTEDSDVSIRTSFNKERIARIDYSIGDMIGSSFGTGVDRRLRGLAGLTYLNYKWNSLLGEKGKTK
jgi:hypothetical protein